MAPEWSGAHEGPGSAAVDHGRTAFDATLTPNRSLPPQGFFVVLAIVGFFNAVSAGVFIANGAWPVVAFCGLDVLLVWIAFRLSYRQGRLRERVRVTDDALDVVRVRPSGQESRWRLHPYWSSVYFDQAAEEDAQVRLVSKGRTLILGAFLSPPERAAFARALGAAIARVKGGR